MYANPILSLEGNTPENLYIPADINSNFLDKHTSSLKSKYWIMINNIHYGSKDIIHKIYGGSFPCIEEPLLNCVDKNPEGCCNSKRQLEFYEAGNLVEMVSWKQNNTNESCKYVINNQQHELGYIDLSSCGVVLVTFRPLFAIKLRISPMANNSLLHLQCTIKKKSYKSLVIHLVLFLVISIFIVLQFFVHYFSGNRLLKTEMYDIIDLRSDNICGTVHN